MCLWVRRPAHPHPHGLLSLQRLQSGSTGVCALITGKMLHIAWLGDSQVILVQQGQVVKLMEPHKPERQVRGSLHPQGTSRAQSCWAYQGSGWSESPGLGCWGELGSNRGLGPSSRKLLSAPPQGGLPCLTQVARESPNVWDINNQRSQVSPVNGVNIQGPILPIARSSQTPGLWRRSAAGRR